MSEFANTFLLQRKYDIIFLNIFQSFLMSNKSSSFSVVKKYVGLRLNQIKSTYLYLMIPTYVAHTNAGL